MTVRIHDEPFTVLILESMNDEGGERREGNKEEKEEREIEGEGNRERKVKKRERKKKRKIEWTENIYRQRKGFKRILLVSSSFFVLLYSFSFFLSLSFLFERKSNLIARKGEDGLFLFLLRKIESERKE